MSLEERKEYAKRLAQGAKAFESKRAKDAGEKDRFYEDFGEGVVTSLKDTYYGVKDLTVGLGDDDMDDLNDWRDDANESGWGTAGQVAGEIGQIMLPMGGAMKGLKAAGKLKRGLSMGKAIAAETGIAGALGGLQLPEENETRTGNIARNAIMTAAGGGIAAGVGKAVKGISKSAEAKRILDAGGYLTPAQAAKDPNSLWRGAENLMAIIPGLSKGTNAAKAKAMKSWGRYAVKELETELGTKLQGGFSPMGLKRLDRVMDEGYMKAWGKAPSVKPDTYAKMTKTIRQAIKDFGSRDTVGLRNILKDARKLLKEPSAKGMKNLDKRIKDAKTIDNRAFNDVVDGLHDTIRQGLGPKTTKALAKMDGIYPKFKTYERVLNSVESTGDLVTPTKLLKASAQQGQMGMRAARRQAPLQAPARAGKKTVDVSGPNILLDAIKGVSQNVMSPVPLQTIGRGVMGQTAIQRGLMKGSPYAKALRNKTGFTGGTAIGEYLKE